MHRERASFIPIAGKSDPTDRQLGALLVEAGKISPHDSERILHRARETGERFGEAAIKLGLVKRDDVELAIAHQFSYPYVLPGRSAISREVVAAYAPFSKRVEPIRAIRAQLLLRWLHGATDRKELALVSCDRRDGRSYVLANLAVAFAQQGERTLLVDADLRASRQHLLFGLDNKSGLTSLLSDRPHGEAVKHVPGFSSLAVITSGPTAPNPQELLSRSRFKELMDHYRREFDVLLFDTSASSAGADAQIVAAIAKGAVILSCLHKSRVAHTATLCEGMRAAGTFIVGAVMNRR